MVANPRAPCGVVVGGGAERRGWIHRGGDQRGRMGDVVGMKSWR